MKFLQEKKNLYFDDLSVNDSKPYGSHFPSIRMVLKKYQRDCLGQNAFMILSILQHCEDCSTDLSKRRAWRARTWTFPGALSTSSLRKISLGVWGEFSAHDLVGKERCIPVGFLQNLQN